MQVCCDRHIRNVARIDFEGYKHPADASVNLGGKLEVVK